MDQKPGKRSALLVWPTFFFILQILLLFSDSAPVLSASPPTLSTPQLGNIIPIRVDNLQQGLFSVAYNSQRQEFLVVWEEEAISGRWEIYGQRVGEDGSLLGNALRLAFDSNYDYSSPAVTYSSTQDNYLVVFTRVFSSTDNDIFSVLLNWDGSTLSTVPIDLTTFDHMSPAITYNSRDDEFLLVYAYKKAGAGGSDILAQRRKAVDGSLVGTTTTIAGVQGEVRQMPKIVYNSTRNEYLIAYTYAADTGIGTFTKNVFKRYNADLSVALTNETALTTNDYAYEVSLSAGPDEFLAVWSEKALGGTEKIWGRRVHGDGTLGGLIQFANRADGRCVDARAAYDSLYGYLITWSFRNVSMGDIMDIFGRALKIGQDTPSGDEFPISHVAYSAGGPFIPDGNQVYSGIACGTAGICLVAYMDNCCPFTFNTDLEIRGRMVTLIAPGGFTKAGPSNGAKGQPTNPTLTWGKSASTASYEYCLDTTPTNLCGNGSWITTGANTTVNLSGLNSGKTYYWQVRARNADELTEADGGSWWGFSTLGLRYLPLVLTAGSGPTPTPPFALTSSAFADGGTIPDKYTYNLSGQCNGQNFSPPLSWTGTPSGTQTLAIILVDPDAANFVHWVQFNIPGPTTELPEAVDGPAVGIKGINDFGGNGYGGPCPPSGTHHYVFTLYALDSTLSLSAGATKTQLDAAMQGHTLKQANLTGLRSP